MSSFCIECGAKNPNIAKFCPQCGTPVFAVDSVNEQTAEAPHPLTDETPKSSEVLETAENQVLETSENQTETLSHKNMAAEPNVSETDVPETDVPETDVPKPTISESAVSEEIVLDSGVLDSGVSDSIVSDPVDVVSMENNLAAAGEMGMEPPKSKAGLFIGLGILALAAAGGGAYGLGLFDIGSKDVERIAEVPEISTPTPSAEIPVETVPTEDTQSAVQRDFSAAISTGRISDLGNFARNYPESSLAKDAEIAALDSLTRQNSVKAFNAFIQQFPNADISSYTGPRTNSDVDNPAAGETVNQTEAPQVVSLLRYSITSRAAELDPFIEQGNTEYALSVIDEMLGWTDLTEDEATFLLNLRAKAETAPGLAVQTETSLLTYDTPASPLERFGAITPDEAVEPGECDVEFSVGVTGQPLNVIPSCTQAIFIQPSIDAVSDWTYVPASLNGIAVQQDGVTVKLKFHIE